MAAACTTILATDENSLEYKDVSPVSCPHPQDVGYDVEFVEENIELEGIACVICSLVMRNPIQAQKCGHRFCSKCIEKYHQTSDGIVCPLDRQPIEIFKDIEREHEILEMNVFCRNRRLCSWQSELRYFEDHIRECPFEIINCEMQCGTKIRRSNMTDHLKNDCPVKFSCEYQWIGCQFTGTKQSFNDHMTKSANQHFLLQMQNEVRKVINDFSEELKAKDLQLEILGERLKKVEGENKQMADEIKIKDVKWIQTENRIAKVEGQIGDLKEENRQMVNEFKTKDEKRKEIEDLTNANKHKNEKDLEDVKKEHEKAITDLKFENQKVVRKVDTFSIQIWKEMETALMKLYPSLRPFIWKVESFSRKLRNAKIKNNAIRSPPFLCLNSYKGEIKLYLNGIGRRKDTHVSIYFCIVDGPFDKMIEWPMPFNNFRIELFINETLVRHRMIPGSAEIIKDFTRPSFRESETGNWGAAELISHQAIPNNIEDDTVTIKFLIC